MSMQLNINYLRSADVPGVDFIDKIVVSAEKVVDIKCHSSGGQIQTYRYDFSAAVLMETSGQSPNGYSDLVYRYLVESDKVTLWIACVVPDDTPLPSPAYQEHEITDEPSYIFLSEGQTERLDTVTSTVAWVTALGTLTYAQKQEIAVREVRRMLEVKEADVERASRYLDLNPAIPTHVGYWWRSAVAVIKRFFQDSDTDPLIVAEMAKQGAAGPTTRDAQLVLLRNLVSLIAQFPNGPDFAAIWVETRNLNTPSDVQRKTILQVLATRGTAADETYDLPTDFDSTNESWIVANQPGIVTYDSDFPATGETLQATLTDYDGGLQSVRYRWQQQAADETWSDMSGGANRRRTWTVGPAGTYRCRVMYHDNYAENQEAVGAAFTVS